MNYAAVDCTGTVMSSSTAAESKTTHVINVTLSIRPTSAAATANGTNRMHCVLLASCAYGHT